MRRRTAILCLWAAVFGLAISCDNASRTTAENSGPPRGERAYAPAVAGATCFRQTVVGRVVLRRTVTLRAAHDGRVADCPWQIGQSVQRGKALLHLSGPRIEGPRRMIEDNIAITREQQTKAQADLHRFAVLLEQRLISGDDKGLVAVRAIARERSLAIDKAKNELAQLESEATVVIPVNGTIVELLVRDGSDVVADQPLAVLSVPSDVAIEAAVFPMHGIHVRTGTRADVYLDAHDKPITARIDYVLPQADGSTGAGVIGIFPGNGAGPLRAGQRVRIDLLGDEVKAIIVPSSAVVSRAGKYFCVKRSGDGPQVIEVDVLDSDGSGRTFLSGGLTPGDEVVTEGAYGIIYRDFRELFTFED